MITVYTGTPGSGKTLAAVREIYRWRKVGRDVITNIPVNIFGVTVIDPEDITLDYFTDYTADRLRDKNFESSVLLVIDEAQLYWNCRDFAAKNRKDWVYFFTHHRKFGYRIILVTQALGFLDKQVRNISEYEYRHKRLSRWGKLGWFFSVVTLGEKYLWSEFYIAGDEYLGIHMNLRMKRYMGMYNTYALPLGADGAGCALARPAPSALGTMRERWTASQYLYLPEFTFGDKLVSYDSVPMWFRAFRFAQDELLRSKGILVAKVSDIVYKVRSRRSQDDFVCDCDDDIELIPLDVHRPRFNLPEV